MQSEQEKEIIIGKLTEIGPKINDTDNDRTVWKEWSLTCWIKTDKQVQGPNGRQPKPQFRLEPNGDIFYDDDMNGEI